MPLLTSILLHADRAAARFATRCSLPTQVEGLYSSSTPPIRHGRAGGVGETKPL
jgi:hypothetical protein